jgi:glycogen synthase
MNILFVCDEFPPGKTGGIGVVVQTLARELVKQGHKVFVVGLYTYSYGQNDYETDEGVKVWRLRYGSKKIIPANHKWVKYFPLFMKRWLNGANVFDKFVGFINELIIKEKIDVIEIPDWNDFTSFIGQKVVWPNFGIPLILKSHGSYTYFAHEMGTRVYRKRNETDKTLFRRADAHISVSEYTAKKNAQIFNIQKQIKVLHNSIPIPELKKLVREDGRVIFMGSLFVKKGIFQLIKAWNIVNEKFPSFELYVFGKGEQEPLKALLNQKAVNSVHFMGHVSRNLLFNELAKASLAVFPSYSETFGLVCIEAMSLGCPVIYTKRSCGPEIVTNLKTGVLVNPDNVEEIAYAIIELMKNNKLRVKLAENAREDVIKRFNIENSAKNHIAFYTETVLMYSKARDASGFVN